MKGTKGQERGKNKAEYLFRERSSVEAPVEFQIEPGRRFPREWPVVSRGIVPSGHSTTASVVL